MQFLIRKFLLANKKKKLDCESKIWMKYGANLLEK